MPETDKKAPRVINKSGTLKMDDKTAATKQVRDIAGRKMDRKNRRDRVKADVAPKEFDDITIAVDRVSHTVAGGRRMRFKAVVAVGNHKNKVGVGVAKGGDVTSAVAKATRKAKKSMVTFNMDGETICHECRIKVTGADVLMKPAAPGTGIIAGGTVRSIMGLTGVKNLISKSLGSTNKVNIAYAVIEGLRAQVPRKDWIVNEGRTPVAKTEKTEKPAETEKPVKAEKVAKKPVEKTEKKAAEKATAKTVKTAKVAEAKKPAAKAAKPAAKKPAAKKPAAKKENK